MSLKSHAGAAFLYAALTVLMTWPLASRLHLMEAGDSSYFAWAMAWTSRALLHDPASLPHANTLHPLRYAYEVTVSEPGCRERASTPPAIWFRAHGDLDGDGEPSLLERAATPKGGVLVPVGPLRIVARTE